MILPWEAWALQWRHNERDGVWNLQRRAKKTSKLCVTGICKGKLTGGRKFSTQSASNAENASIWWRHHGLRAFKTQGSRQNGHHFADVIFQIHFFIRTWSSSIYISLKFVPKCPNKNKVALVQIMGLPRTGDKHKTALMISWSTEGYLRQSDSVSYRHCLHVVDGHLKHVWQNKKYSNTISQMQQMQSDT